ncbi:hypothetical protein OS493_000689 [Desmophyllum pertusum]|uniref:Uncharacterized protein n=1 Tax=Desmophyllum pertusum TaxID=174260 RepID=A0A9X0ABA4_9CNID|nr:hypothetical protein OS493_000689 [Desmophyllum pertusum]
MVFKNGCCCPQHAEWGYGTVDPKQLFRLTYPEERFCGVGRCSSFGHKGRIRKICVFCRERIRLQKRCETLEAASSSHEEEFCDDSLTLDGSLQHEESCDVFYPLAEIGEDVSALSELKSSEDKACQVPETVQIRQGYESLGVRRKRDLRSEIMSEMDKLLENYTSLGDKGAQAIMRDILSSQNFRASLVTCSQAMKAAMMTNF